MVSPLLNHLLKSFYLSFLLSSLLPSSPLSSSSLPPPSPVFSFSYLLSLHLPPPLELFPFFSFHFFPFSSSFTQWYSNLFLVLCSGISPNGIGGRWNARDQTQVKCLFAHTIALAFSIFFVFYFLTL